MDFFSYTKEIILKKGVSIFLDINYGAELFMSGICFKLMQNLISLVLNASSREHQDLVLCNQIQILHELSMFSIS